MKKILTIFLVMLSVQVFSQEKNISGTVVDETGQPLLGVTILLKGVAKGTVTDFDGGYTINAKTGDVLVFSFLGTETKEVTVGNQNTINVTLTNTDTALDEVVVVGYGTVKKSDLTGSVSSVKAEEITRIGAIGLDQALAGRAAGVLVTQSSGMPGGGAAIRIRAVSSLNGSDPLYVIDGVPLENMDAQGLGEQDLESAAMSPLSMINPSDIESVEILKDASSTAIYGSRGANGVILITTKKGKSGKGVVTVEHDYGVTEIGNFIDVLDANQYVILNAERNINIGNTLTASAIVQLDSARAGLLRTSDWQKTITSPGNQSNTNLSFSGGNEDVRYLISSNFLKADGVVDRTDYQRASVRANINANMSKNFKVGATMNYTHVTSEQRSINTGLNSIRGQTNVILRALRASPLTGIDAEDEADGINLWTPVTNLLGNEYNNLLTQFVGSMFAELSLTKALSLKTQITHQNRNTDQRYYQYDIFPNNVAEGGRARTTDRTANTSTITNTLRFNKRFGKHSVNLVLGQSFETSTTEAVSVSNFGFANDLLTYYDPGSATFFDPDRVTYVNTNLSSYFGRLTYNFKGKYLFDLTGRLDGSSKFAANKKWAFFPAAAFAYKLSEEKFLKNIDDISEIKLRLSYGTSGNQAIQPYQSLDQYASSLTPFNEQSTTVYYQNQLPNPNLTWETTTQLDAGLDFGLFNNKISGTFEYYEKTTEDLLFAGNRIPVQSGQDTFTENFGTLETIGIEGTLTARIITNEKMTWSITGNVSTGKTKVKSMASDNLFSGWDPGFISGGTQRLIIGEEIGAFYGHQESGIAQFDDFVEFQGLTDQERIDMYNANPSAVYTFVDGFNGGITETPRPGQQLYEDVTPDGVLTAEDRKVIGYAQPDIMFSINNSFTFGNLDFSFFIDSQQGKDVANIGNNGLLGFGGGQKLTTTLDRWTPENPSAKWPRLGSDSSITVFTSRIIEDASFVRLQNVTIGYNLAKEVTDKLNISGLRVYVSGTNLYIWTNYTGFSPDVSLRGSNTTSLGHDNSGYPQGRVIRLGVNLKF